MSTITAQMIAEFKALGWRCVAHGPEAWLGIAAVCGVLCVGVFAGMLLAALLGANGRDDDERR